MNDGWLERALAHIRLFSSCVPTRGEINATSTVTVAAAEALARSLHSVDLEPERITHGADGQITFWFSTKRVRIAIVVDEDDGELLMCLRRKSDDADLHVEAFSSGEAAASAKSWLNGGWVKLFETS